MLMPDDKFNIKMIYPSMSGDDNPKSWFIADGWGDDPRVRLSEKISGNNNDGYKLDDNSAVRITVSGDSKDVDIDCDNDFADSLDRGYVYKVNDWMGKANSGVEMTCYFWLSNVDQSDNSVKGNPISMKGPTGEHHSNTTCCSGSAYMEHIGGEDEDLENRIALQFTKEMYHVSYHTKGDYKIIPDETWSILDSKWFGVKYIVYKKTINNVKSVVLETWLNPSADKQSWKKVSTTTDSGGWGDDGDECGGEKGQVLYWGNSRMMLRWDYRDGADIKFKNWSIRQIDPNADFEPDPNQPDTDDQTVSTFRSTLKLQRNINSAVSLCDFGGLSEGFSISDSSTYITRTLADQSTQSYRTRVTERANPVGGSTMVGKTFKEAWFILRKLGTPPSTVRCKIYDSSGVQKYQSVNTITATTLSTSFGSYSIFDLSTNTYVMQNGDKIGIEYTASADDTNAIAIKCRDPGDGSSGSYYDSFNNNTDNWTDFTTRDVICILWV